MTGREVLLAASCVTGVAMFLKFAGGARAWWIPLLLISRALVLLIWILVLSQMGRDWQAEQVQFGFLSVHESTFVFSCGRGSGSGSWRRW